MSQQPVSCCDINFQSFAAAATACAGLRMGWFSAAHLTECGSWDPTTYTTPSSTDIPTGDQQGGISDGYATTKLPSPSKATPLGSSLPFQPKRAAGKHLCVFARSRRDSYMATHNGVLHYRSLLIAPALHVVTCLLALPRSPLRHDGKCRIGRKCSEALREAVDNLAGGDAQSSDGNLIAGHLSS